MNYNLKQARENVNLTQQDVANELFITRQTISRWETGVRDPSLSAINDLAKLYKISVPELLGYEIELKKKTNYLAVLGSLFFNVFFVMPISLVLMLFLFIGWIFATTIAGTPLLALYRFVANKGNIQFVIYNYRPQGLIRSSSIYYYICSWIGSLLWYVAVICIYLPWNQTIL